MSRLEVCIVDDDEDFAQSLAMLLQLEGHQVEIAANGERAVEVCRDREFDVTFMDVRLPGMNGVESFLEIRKLRPHSKVMMMTAYSMEDLVKDAVDQGALGIMNKPLDIDKLLTLLESVMPAGVILLADDDPDFADSIYSLLKMHQYRVLVASTGQAAIDIVLAGGIDVLLLDLRLPVVSGLEVYLQLKTLGKTLPTVIVTGYADEEADGLKQLRALSVTQALTKPIEPIELLGAIEASMEDTRR